MQIIKAQNAGMPTVVAGHINSGQFDYQTYSIWVLKGTHAMNIPTSTAHSSLPFVLILFMETKKHTRVEWPNTGIVQVAAPIGKLIVLAAFDETDEGDLVPAFDPREFNDAGRAKREAQVLAAKHAGVIAWQRTADPQLGEYGEPEILFQQGKIPEME